MYKLAAATAALLIAAPAAAQSPKPDEAAFRSLYKELVETNTTVSAGSCTLAAQRMGARLTAGGFPAPDVRVLGPENLPKDWNLVAVLPGRDPKAGAVMLLAHIDVVEAKREDWVRDPFTLVEEDGYFLGRGTSDDKAQAAIWVDSLIRFRQEGFRPRRTLKVVLTCGEESGGRSNGATWLTQNHRSLIDAEFGLNEGGGGELDAQGARRSHNIQAAEKAHIPFWLEVTNPGGHSSRPVRDNAIYRLGRALQKVEAHEFPVRFNDANRGYFSRMSRIVGGETGQAMAALVANPGDAKAAALLTQTPSYRAMLRTTCVATMLEGGHAINALPQRARAGLSCRIMPGETAAEVRQRLIAAIGDSQVNVLEPAARATAPLLTLPPKVMGPIETVSQQVWPGVPVVPFMVTGATDARVMNLAGIPTYGVTGIFHDPDGGFMHGLNERVRVRSLMEAREFLYRLLKAYGDQPG